MYSVTYVGAIIMFLSFLAKITGTELPFTEADVGSLVTTITGFIGFVTTIWGRFRQGDVNIFGAKV